MTHLNPGGGGLAAPPLTLSRPTPAARLELQRLREGIAERRRRLLDLELAMVAACETKAARGRAPGVLMHNRETWDRATWDRYLAAAAAVEAEYGPPMRKLYREIDQLERVLALPIGGGLAA